MCKLDEEATMAFRVLYGKVPILLGKVAEFDGSKIFHIVAGVKPLAERYNRR
jgi:hypothetical protein